MKIFKSIASIGIITCSVHAFAGVTQTAWDFEQGPGVSNNNGDLVGFLQEVLA